MTPASTALVRFPSWLVLGGAVAIGCIYLPTLTARFDFVDDGNLVYPTGPMSWDERLACLGQRIRANYQHLGPFRPVLHAIWMAEAELLGPDERGWRVTRLAWTVAAAGMLLWLLRELGLRASAALLATALAFWNPYRNEIWTSLTLGEGVAAPFALLALVAAVRAARSARPWCWDLAGLFAILAALGCKNTFAAVVPAQMLLRTWPQGITLREGLRCYGWRAAALSVTLLLPAVHLVFYQLHWQAGQYQLQALRPSFVGVFGRALLGALSIDVMAAGLVVTLLAIWRDRVCGRDAPAPAQPSHRPIALAALLLLAAGVAMYLPIQAVAGRYTMPAVWGLDLLLALSLDRLGAARSARWRWAAYATLVLGLVAVALACLDRQQKCAARAAVLWQALEYIEQTAPPGSCVGWSSGPALNLEEGIHFAWHLRARGRGDLKIRILDEEAKSVARPELPPRTDPLDLLVTGTASSAPGTSWQLVGAWSASFRFGRRCYVCYVWKPVAQPEPTI